MNSEQHSGPKGDEGALREQQANTAEAEFEHQMRIYVASLADYNAGRLHGEWIDAHQTADELHSAVTAMLAASP